LFHIAHFSEERRRVEAEGEVPDQLHRRIAAPPSPWCLHLHLASSEEKKLEEAEVDDC